MSSGYGFRPWALGVRFALELAALACFGLWAWVTTPVPLQYVSVIAAPVAVAVLWGRSRRRTMRRGPGRR